jgi:hypothetical protein
MDGKKQVQLKASTIILIKESLLDTINHYRDKKQNVTVGEEDPYGRQDLYGKQADKYLQAYEEIEAEQMKGEAPETFKSKNDDTGL